VIMKSISNIIALLVCDQRFAHRDKHTKK